MSNWKIDVKGLEACLAFGETSLAVHACARAVAAAGAVPEEVRELADELKASHDQLRRLFATGATDGLVELATSITVLAWRTCAALGRP